MTTWDLQEESGTSGAGWLYDEVNLTYDNLLDPDSGLPVFYDGLGSTVSWTNLTKSS